MGALAAVVAAPHLLAAQAKAPLIVYKDANCGCCHLWVEYMQARGYKATVTNTDMNRIKAQYKIPQGLASCHTTLVGGYIIEGHVPAPDIEAFLKQKPTTFIGLTIPGMPASAPGMDQLPFVPYEVLTFDAQGRTTVFAKHTKPTR